MPRSDPYTYVPTQQERFLYLAVVIDVWSRWVVGWSMRNDMATPLVTDALDMAIATRRPDRVIHHSDRGSPIHFHGVRDTLSPGRLRSVHGTERRRLRQRRSRIVLRHPRNRTPRPDQLRHPQPGPISGLRLHRRVLQPTPAALRHRIPLTHRLLKEHANQPSYHLNPQAENCPQKWGNSTTPTPPPHPSTAKTNGCNTAGLPT